MRRFGGSGSGQGMSPNRSNRAQMASVYVSHPLWVVVWLRVLSPRVRVQVRELRFGREEGTFRFGNLVQGCSLALVGGRISGSGTWCKGAAWGWEATRLMHLRPLLCLLDRPRHCGQAPVLEVHLPAGGFRRVVSAPAPALSSCDTGHPQSCICTCTCTLKLRHWSPAELHLHTHLHWQVVTLATQ